MTPDTGKDLSGGELEGSLEYSAGGSNPHSPPTPTQPQMSTDIDKIVEKAMQEIHSDKPKVNLRHLIRSAIEQALQRERATKLSAENDKWKWPTNDKPKQFINKVFRLTKDQWGAIGIEHNAAIDAATAELRKEHEKHVWNEKHRQREYDQNEINEWTECALAKQREIESLRRQLEEAKIANAALAHQFSRATERAIKSEADLKDRELRLFHAEADKERLIGMLGSLHRWMMEKAPQHYNGCGLWIDVDGELADAARKDGK